MSKENEKTDAAVVASGVLVMQSVVLAVIRLVGLFLVIAVGFGITVQSWIGLILGVVLYGLVTGMITSIITKLNEMKKETK